jgi:integrase
METMKKPWVYKRRHIKGWWVGWYERGKRKAKALPSKSLAEHFRHIKYTQLNADVFTSIIDSDWQQMVEEYRRFKQVEGLQEASIYEAMLTLGHFKRLAGPHSSRSVTQNVLDQFILDRGQEVGRNTLNKDIRNLNAFLSWAAKNHFVSSGLAVKKVKVAQKPVAALSPQQVRDLLAAASRYCTLRLRVLLAVTTGLRRGDIEAIRIGDIHFDRNTIATRNRKAGKAMAERPVPERSYGAFNYVATLSDGQSDFTDRFSPKKWRNERLSVCPS